MKIGVLGGGQLGRMLALSGIPMGHEFVFLDPNPDACAATVGSLMVGEYDDPDALKALAEECDVVTYEFENVPVQSIETLETLVPVHPGKQVLESTQDRVIEKTVAQENGIPTAQFLAVDSPASLDAAIEEISLPCILKTRRMGYDGKGQVCLRTPEDLPEGKELVEQQPCILEQCISFEREVSIIATRSKTGEIAYYPLTENVHRNGILHTSRAPAIVNDETEKQAQQIAETLLNHFDYVGTMAVELFVLGDGSVLLNEVAPRVHNSGHWTIEGAQTSQFANHVRAIAGVPLGSTALRGHSGMINLIGMFPAMDDVMQIANIQVHLYGKSERPGRKIGHLTVCHEDKAEVDTTMETLEKVIAVL